ncbi:hypothetical protein ATCC90586_011795 [Pythium insidiosum]|nr:hypothetical protein ATCC90586_011795 [Pythium insidiosum]
MAALMRGVGVKARAQLKLHDVVDYKAVIKRMNTTGLLKFTLNYDPHAEVNWQRRTNADDAIELLISSDDVE